MSKFELAYSQLVSDVLKRGDVRPSRVGNTISVFGTTLTIDCLEQGLFPVLTQRKIFMRGILGELAAFLQGADDLATFKALGCNYWDDNAAKWNQNIGLPQSEQLVGRIYGVQWRSWTSLLTGTVDQLERLVRSLQQDPYSRRHLLTTYNPAELVEGCLPPCHLLAQFNVRPSGYLDCVVTMRSVDLCLGLPSDIVLYAALLSILAQETGYHPGKLVFMMGDSHVYENHIQQLPAQFARPTHPLPSYTLAKQANINNFVATDLELIGYVNSGVLKYDLNT